MDEEYCYDMKDCEGPLLGRKPSTKRTTRAKVFDLFKLTIELSNTLLLLILLGLLICLLLLHKHDKDFRATDRGLELLSFGADERYMSLDASYDVMWEAFGGETAAVINAPTDLLRPEDLAQEGTSAKEHWGAVSMYTLC